MGGVGRRTWLVASRGWDGGGGCWSGWGRACRCHWRLVCPYLPQLFSAASGILMTLADLQPREAQGLALQLWKAERVRSRSDTEAAPTDRTQACQQLWKLWEQKVKRLWSGYFWACVCCCNINNGWGRRWECSTGNKNRHPCQHRENQEFRVRLELGAFLSLKSPAIHLHSAANTPDKRHLIHYSAKTADYFVIQG